MTGRGGRVTAGHVTQGTCSVNCSRIRWSVRGTPTSIITSGLQCQEIRGASGLTGIKPQLVHLCDSLTQNTGRTEGLWETESSILIGSLIKATLLEWNSPTSLH